MRTRTAVTVLAVCALISISCGEEEERPSDRPPPDPQSPWKVAFDFYHGELGATVGFTGLQFTGTDSGWACAKDRVFRYDGHGWRLLTNLGERFPSYNISLLALSAPAANDVWVGGDIAGPADADLFHYDGSSWAAVSTGVSAIVTVNDAFFLAPNRGWIATSYYWQNPDNGHIIYYDGKTWTSQLDGPDICDLHFESENDGWACGEYEGEQRLYRWDGSSWTEVRLPGARVTELYSMDFTGPDDGWLVASRIGATSTTILFHYDGSTWKEMPCPMRYGGDCGFVSPKYGWLADAELESWLYEDGVFTPYPWPWEHLGWIEICARGKDDVWAGTGGIEGHAYILHFSGVN
jgi:hypothetical protein